MPSKLERRQIIDNSEKAEPITSAQILQEIEGHYKDAGLESLEFLALKGYTDYLDVKRGFKSNIGDPTLSERAVDGVLLTKILKAAFFAKKLEKAYIVEGASGSESLNKTAVQFNRIRDQLLSTKTQSSVNPLDK
jgi:hypothetical protein